MLLGIPVVLGLVLSTGAWSQVQKTDASLLPTGKDGRVFLLVGSDRREDVPAGEERAYGTAQQVPGERADIILLVRPTSDGVKLLGIPRDLLVLQPDGQTLRMNQIFEREGIAGTAAAICNMLGVPVTHAMVARFATVETLVNSVGGIDIESDGEIRDLRTGMHLRKGTNHLDGPQAVAFVRSRFIDTKFGDGWLPDDRRNAQRAERAFTVVDGIARKMRLTPFDPLRLPRTAWNAAASLEVSSTSSPWALGQLALSLRSMKSLTTADSVQVPTVPRVGPVPALSLRPDSVKVVSDFLGRIPGCPA